MKVLHLASWYPNNTNPQEGDFIQRHARAVAALAPLHLIHVVKDASLATSVKTVERSEGGLHETIIYYKPFTTGFRKIDRLISLRTYQRIYREAIRAHISKQGLPELVHVHVAMRAGLPALWMKKKYGVPFIVSEHWSGYYRSDPDNFFKRDRYFRTGSAAIFRQAAVVTAVSADLVKQLKSIFSIGRTAVVYNCVDTKQFNAAGLTERGVELPDKRTEFTLIHVSNMHPIKNVAGLFRVMTRLKQIRQDWRLVMLGEIAPGYRELAAQARIEDHVIFKGSVDHGQVPSALKNADALILFSHHENLSCVVCESLCCGRPVLATAVGGLPEIVNESNGRLVPPGDEDELLQQLLNLLNTHHLYDPSRISSEAARLFDDGVIARQFTDVYEIALQNPVKSPGSPAR